MTSLSLQSETSSSRRRLVVVSGQRLLHLGLNDSVSLRFKGRRHVLRAPSDWEAAAHTPVIFR